MDSRQKEERRDEVRRLGDPWIRKQILKTLADLSLVVLRETYFFMWEHCHSEYNKAFGW